MFYRQLPKHKEIPECILKAWELNNEIQTWCKYKLASNDFLLSISIMCITAIAYDRHQVFSRLSSLSRFNPKLRISILIFIVLCYCGLMVAPQAIFKISSQRIDLIFRFRKTPSEMKLFLTLTLSGFEICNLSNKISLSSFGCTTNK